MQRGSVPRGLKYAFALSVLGASVALAAPAPLTLKNLDGFWSEYSDLLVHRGSVKQMLIQQENWDRNAKTTMSASSATVTINPANTELVLRFQRATPHEYKLVVDAPNRRIFETEKGQSDDESWLIESTRRFNAAGCNHSTTRQVWGITPAAAYRIKESAPSEQNEMQTFCDTRQRPTKTLIQMTSRRDGGEPSSYIMVNTWKWSPDRLWVAEEGWEYTLKRFFNASGDPITEMVSQLSDRREVRYVYTYDSQGNWIKRVTTVHSGAYEAKVLPITAKYTVTRELMYW